MRVNLGSMIFIALILKFRFNNNVLIIFCIFFSLKTENALTTKKGFNFFCQAKIYNINAKRNDIT